MIGKWLYSAFGFSVRNSTHYDRMLPLNLSRLLFLSFLSLSTDNNYHSTLQEVEVPIINRQACERLYNPISSIMPESEPVIGEDMICAGDTYKMKDSCKVRVCSWNFLTWNLNVDPGFPICKQWISKVIMKQLFWQ